MPYASGEDAALVGDLVGRDGPRGQVVAVRGTQVEVAVGERQENWDVASCRLLVPAPDQPLRPRPGWERPFLSTFGRTATQAVERSGVYILRADGRFRVGDNRDAVFPHRRLGPSSGLETIDEAYRVADAALGQLPVLQLIAKEVEDRHADVVEAASGSPYEEFDGEAALQFSIVLRDLPDEALYEGAALRPIEETVRGAAAREGLERFVHVRYILAAERDRGPQVAAEEGTSASGGSPPVAG